MNVVIETYQTDRNGNTKKIKTEVERMYPEELAEELTFHDCVPLTPYERRVGYIMPTPIIDQVTGIGTFYRYYPITDEQTERTLYEWVTDDWSKYRSIGEGI